MAINPEWLKLPKLHLNLQKHAAANAPRTGGTIRQRLKRVVASRSFHVVVLCLIIVDVLVVFTSIILELLYPEYEYTVLQCTAYTEAPPAPIPLAAVCATNVDDCVVQAVRGQPEDISAAITALEYTSVAIVSCMAAEIIFTAVVVGRAWFTVLHMFDAAVIIASLVIEVVLKSKPDLRQVWYLLRVCGVGVCCWLFFPCV